MQYWIGQACGIIATIVGVSVPIFKKKWQMLVMSIANNIFCALNLIFLDRIGSGIFLFAVGAVQALVNLVHDLRKTQGALVEKLIFIALYLGLGFYGLVTGPGFVPAVNARNLLELLPIIAAVMNMCFVFSRTERTARIFFVACNGMWMIYYVIIGSSAMLCSLISVATGLITLYKNREKPAA